MTKQEKFAYNRAIKDFNNILEILAMKDKSGFSAEIKKIQRAIQTLRMK